MKIAPEGVNVERRLERSGTVCQIIIEAFFNACNAVSVSVEIADKVLCKLLVGISTLVRYDFNILPALGLLRQSQETRIAVREVISDLAYTLLAKIL